MITTRQPSVSSLKSPHLNKREGIPHLPLNAPHKPLISHLVKGVLNRYNGELLGQLLVEITQLLSAELLAAIRILVLLPSITTTTNTTIFKSLNGSSSQNDGWKQVVVVVVVVVVEIIIVLALKSRS